MATSPNFVNTPKVGMVQVTTANTNRNGTGTIVTVFTAGTLGSRVDWIEITAVGTTTNNVIRLFISDGTTTWLMDEILITANTPSVTNRVSRQTVVYSNPLVLQPNWSLRASTNNTETYNIIAFGGDF